MWQSSHPVSATVRYLLRPVAGVLHDPWDVPAEPEDIANSPLTRTQATGKKVKEITPFIRPECRLTESLLHFPPLPPRMLSTAYGLVSKRNSIPLLVSHLMGGSIQVRLRFTYACWVPALSLGITSAAQQLNLLLALPLQMRKLVFNYTGTVCFINFMLESLPSLFYTHPTPNPHQIKPLSNNYLS